MYTLYKVFIILYCGWLALVGMGFVLVVPGHVRQSYQRTQGRWPHAGMLWTVHAIALECICIGAALITLFVLVYVTTPAAVIPIVLPLIPVPVMWQLLLGCSGAGLMCLGSIIQSVWFHTFYRPACRRYGRVNSSTPGNGDAHEAST